MDDLIIFLAKYLIFIVALVCLAAWLGTKAKTRWQFATAALIAVALALIFIKLSDKIYFHQRPFVVSNVQPLVEHAANNAFVSDHTTVAAAAATVVYFYRRRLGQIALSLALLVGLSRIWAHLHWPVDVLVGLVLGMLSGWLGYKLAKRLLPSSQEPAVNQKHD